MFQPTFLQLVLYFVFYVWLTKEEAQESVSVTVLLLEASRIAFLCWTATQKPTLVYAKIAFGHAFPKAVCRMHDITYPRASTVAQSLTEMKFCENFQQSRISADKRYLIMSLHPASLDPRPGLLRCGLHRKVSAFSTIYIILKL